MTDIDKEHSELRRRMDGLLEMDDPLVLGQAVLRLSALLKKS